MLREQENSPTASIVSVYTSILHNASTASCNRDLCTCAHSVIVNGKCIRPKTPSAARSFRYEAVRRRIPRETPCIKPEMRRGAITRTAARLDDCVEKRGNPVVTPIVRDCFSCVQGGQRRVGVEMKQTLPWVAGKLRDLVRGTC